jgi:uncharacterized protein
MSIFAIGDLHLSHNFEKPMDIFGNEWLNHAEKIGDNWTRVVRADDLVIVTGDISWAMYFSDALPDLRWIAALPGTKLLIRGNHDYWWPSISRLRAELPESVYALQNDYFPWEDQVICGTRGWLCPGEEGFDNDHDQKLYEREVQRLQLSLQSAKQAKFSELIAALHFPPFNRKGQSNAFTELLEEFNVTTCLFGHIHDSGRDYIFQGSRNGVTYRFVAADGISFTPLQII